MYSSRELSAGHLNPNSVEGEGEICPIAATAVSVIGVYSPPAFMASNIRSYPNVLAFVFASSAVLSHPSQAVACFPLLLHSPLGELLLQRCVLDREGLSRSQLHLHLQHGPPALKQSQKGSSSRGG